MAALKFWWSCYSGDCAGWEEQEPDGLEVLAYDAREAAEEYVTLAGEQGAMCVDEAVSVQVRASDGDERNKAERVETFRLRLERHYRAVAQ